MVNKNQASRQRVVSAVREKEAMDLRIAGATMQQIADALGYASASGAWHAIRRGLESLPHASADELRSIQGARIEAAIMAIWPKITRGDERAILALVRLLQREARLYGLDAPAKLEIGLEDVIRDMAQRAAEKFPDLDEAEVVAMAEQLLKESKS